MGFQLWIFLVGLLCADHATGLFLGSCWEVCKELKKLILRFLHLFYCCLLFFKINFFLHKITECFCFLFDLMLYIPSTIFQLNSDRSSWVEPVLSKDKCVLLKDHNTVTLVRPEPGASIKKKNNSVSNFMNQDQE